MGVSGAGSAAFLPYRPLFILGAVGMLWLGHSLLEKEERECEADRLCGNPAVRRRMRNALWIATALVFILGTSATWIHWVL